MLRTAIRIFVRRLPSVLLLIGLAGVGGLLTLATATPRYDATSTVLLTVQPTGTAYEALAGSLYASTRITSYAAVAQTPAVLTPVIEQLGLDVSAGELAQRVRTVADTSGLTIDLICSAGSAAEARDLADQVAAQLGRVVESKLEADSTSQGSVVALTLTRPASLPDQPAYPVPAVVIAESLIVGLIVAIGITLLRELGRRTVRTASELRELGDHPVIARVPAESRRFRQGSGERHPALQDREDDAFDTLLTAIRYSRFESRTAVTLVTAPERAAGATTIAIGLAASLARRGQRTVLVDANLTEPTVAASVGVTTGPGVSDVVTRHADHRTGTTAVPGHDGLWMLGAGARVPNPHDILASKRFRQLIAELADAFDEVVIDTPPIGEHLLTATIAESAGSTVLVVGIRSSSRDDVSRAVRALEAASAPFAGFVANRVSARERTSSPATRIPRLAVRP